MPTRRHGEEFKRRMLLARRNDRFVVGTLSSARGVRHRTARKQSHCQLLPGMRRASNTRQRDRKEEETRQYVDLNHLDRTRTIRSSLGFLVLDLPHRTVPGGDPGMDFGRDIRRLVLGGHFSWALCLVLPMLQAGVIDETTLSMEDVGGSTLGSHEEGVNGFKSSFDEERWGNRKICQVLPAKSRMGRGTKNIEAESQGQHPRGKRSRTKGGRLTEQRGGSVGDERNLNGRRTNEQRKSPGVLQGQEAWKRKSQIQLTKNPRSLSSAHDATLLEGIAGFSLQAPTDWLAFVDERRVLGYFIDARLNAFVGRPPGG
ncbi:hypothetical protein BKA70DRAFT_1230989 [Coprinopsis sp. MPI-PUGE-AT-0042]|nr:hypothetical protein BKA70DRAFT_1230989 [Coprinopsis sp. MPI-PUGE-AT-0042]